MKVWIMMLLLDGNGVMQRVNLEFSTKRSCEFMLKQTLKENPNHVTHGYCLQVLTGKSK